MYSVGSVPEGAGSVDGCLRVERMDVAVCSMISRFSEER